MIQRDLKIGLVLGLVIVAGVVIKLAVDPRLSTEARMIHLNDSTGGLESIDSNNISENNIKKFGSQGQQKTFLVALKMAQFDFIKEIKKFDPVILLDDIFDKFDQERVQQILKLVSENHFGQIFITHTNEQRIQEVMEEITSEYSLFRVENNEINKVNNA